MSAFLSNWIEAERGRFLLLLPVAMGAAILAYFALPTEPPLWLAWALPAAAVAALAAGWRHPATRFGAALALAGALGFARIALLTQSEPGFAAMPRGAVGITGTVSRIDLLPGARRLTLSHPSVAGGAPMPRAIRLRLRADDPALLAVGQRISAFAMLFGPERPAYPGGWDAARQDFFAGLGASGFAVGPVKITQAAAPDSAGAWLQNLRAGIAARIMAILPPATGAIAVTLLTGDEQAIPTPERQNFIAAGLAHILAVAGLHVGIIMGLFYAASRYVLTRHERLALRLPVKPIAALLALLAGAGYAALTGAHLPILRSLAMASLVTLGILAGRRAFSLRGLALAALVILLATPQAIIGVSFQMSFSAVLALIAGHAAARHILARLHAATTLQGRAAAHAAALGFTSLLAGGASMPFAAYQFQQIQPYWIPANLLAVPLTAFWILPFGLLALALMPLGLAPIALVPMGWGIALIVWLTTRIAAWPHAMLRIPPMTNAAILLITLGLIWLCLWRSAPRLAGIPIMLAGLLAYAAARPPDVLVSPDATRIAIRAGTQIFLVSGRKTDSYTLSQWAPIWGSASLIEARCSANLCRLGPVLLAMSPPAACGDAALVVSPASLRGACGTLPAIDRFSVYANGATAAWITATSVRLRTDRGVQGTRPWVIPYPNITTLR